MFKQDFACSCFWRNAQATVLRSRAEYMELVFWANRSVGIQSCWRRPCHPFVRQHPTRLWYAPVSDSTSHFPDMPCMKRFTKITRRRYTVQQPRTKSAFRPANKLRMNRVLNHGSTAGFVLPPVYMGIPLFVLAQGCAEAYEACRSVGVLVCIQSASTNKKRFSSRW